MKITDAVSPKIEDEPRAQIPSSVAIVCAVLGLFLLLLALYTLYALKLAPMQTEAIWFASQEKQKRQIAQAQDGTVVTLERHPCFRYCPGYSVSLDASGRVEFRGEAYVCEARPAPIVVDASAVAQLVDGLTTVRFEEMPSYTHVDIFDASRTTITLRRPNTVHVVEHYHGDNAAPRLLTLIADRIDEVSESSRWVGIRKDYNGNVLERECTGSDGSKRPIARLVR